MAERVLLCFSLMMQFRKVSVESELLCNHLSGSGEGCSLGMEQAVPEIQGRSCWPVYACSSRIMLQKKQEQGINNLLSLDLDSC